MVDVNVVAFKIGELKDRMDRVRSHCPDRPEDFVADRDALDIVSFNLLLAAKTGLPDLERFASEVSVWLRSGS